VVQRQEFADIFRNHVFAWRRASQRYLSLSHAQMKVMISQQHQQPPRQNPIVVPTPLARHALGIDVRLQAMTATVPQSRGQLAEERFPPTEGPAPL
jgi:hypothetical protein